MGRRRSAVSDPITRGPEDTMRPSPEAGGPLGDDVASAAGAIDSDGAGRPGGGFFDEIGAGADSAAGDGSEGPPPPSDDGRLSPSRSALRRRRSAWASTMLDEWLLTPMPSSAQRSRISLFESPSSRANS